VIDFISAYARSFFNDDRTAVKRSSWKAFFTGNE